MKLIQSTILIAAFGAVLVSCKKETVSNPGNPAPPPPPPPPISKMDACLKFDNNITDSLGKITGTISGNISYANDRKGNANSALYLDGATKITFPGLNIKGKAFTMSAWLKYFNGGGGLQIVAHAMNNLGGPALEFVSDQPGAAISTPGTNSVLGTNVNNSWHHVAMTYDGTDIRLYVDGALQGTTNHPGSMGDSPRDLVIGFFLNKYWKGYIDDMRIFSEVKTAADIQKLAE